MEIIGKIANPSRSYAELYQSQKHFNKTQTTEFFKYLYSYPPQVTIKWNSLDELNQDSLLTKDKEALALNFPFVDFMEAEFFKSKTQIATPENYTLKEFVSNFRNKVSTATFYNQGTKTIQENLWYQEH